MKDYLHKNPLEKGVSTVWEEVNLRMADNLTGEARAAFINKKGKFEDIHRSLYHVKHSSIPNNPKDEREFDTTFDCINYNTQTYDLDLDLDTKTYIYHVIRLYRNFNAFVIRE